MAEKTFNSSFDQTLATIENFESDNQKNIENAIRIFNLYGFCILRSYRILDRKDFLSIGKKIFGSIDKRHSRANKDGITEIKELGGFSSYIGSTNKEHQMHTDGPFESPPPDIFGLMCVKPSNKGGQTLITSSKRVVNHLKGELDEKLLMLLFEDLEFKRGQDYARNPILVKNKNDHLSLNFRFDEVIEIKGKSMQLEILKLINEFVKKANNQIKIKWYPNQILFGDNGAIIHGRTSFPKGEKRLLYRIWLKKENINITLGF